MYTYPVPINELHIISYCDIKSRDIIINTELLSGAGKKEYMDNRIRTGKGGLKASRSLWRTPMLTDKIT